MTVDARRSSTTEVVRELAIASSGYLPTILAQHLFTSFIWTIAEHLSRDCLRQGFSTREDDVEIDGRHRFVVYEFSETWHRPTLRHRMLTKVVRQMEVYGLGSFNDILLCMVPALSFKDLLPNNTMLKLMPQPERGATWLEASRAYKRLLDSKIGTSTGENFCYAVVTAVLDFLYIACEPYDEYITAPAELRQELVRIVKKLLSSKFAAVVAKLAPVYELQGRREQFLEIFRFYRKGNKKGKNLESLRDYSLERFLKADSPFHRLVAGAFINSSLDIEVGFLERKLGFSKGHQLVYQTIKRERDKSLSSKKHTLSSPVDGPMKDQSKEQTKRLKIESFGPNGKCSVLCRLSEGCANIEPAGKEAFMVDIFGWTPLVCSSQVSFMSGRFANL